jgi:hypothetical protein
LHAPALNANEDEIGNPIVKLDNLIRHPAEGAVHSARVEQDRR